MTNLFANARVASKPAKTAKSKEKAEIEVSGLADLAAVDALIKSLAAVKETLEAQVKAQALAEFKTQVNQGRKLENFRGVDDGASASCEFRKRSTASALNEADIDMLRRFDIPFGLNVSVESCYRINPKYTGDSKLLGKISSAISKVKDVPEDFIELQEGVSKPVVTEDTITVASRNPEAFDAVATVIGTLAVKPKLDETDTVAIMDRVRELIG
jgi:hypothetical protein